VSDSEGGSMPLREADLKSVPACKRAFAGDNQSIRMGAALRFWIYQKVDVGMGVDKETFALFPVLVDNRGVRDLMTKNGSAVLCQGICYLAKDLRTIVFETESRELNAALLNKAVASLMGGQQAVARITGAGAQRQGG